LGMEEKPRAVVDLGSIAVRLGQAGEDEATICEDLLTNGDYAGMLDKGIVHDWKKLERLLLLRLEGLSFEGGILISERPLTPKMERERMCELVFEKLEAPSYWPIDRGTLSLVGQGREVGMSLHIGHDISWVVPVVDLKPALWRSHVVDLGCETLFHHFLGLIGRSDVGPEQLPGLRSLFHQVAKASPNPREREEGQETAYTLPDGSTISIGKERYQALEPLFNFAEVNLYYSNPYTQGYPNLNSIMDMLDEPLNDWSIMSAKGTRATGLWVYKGILLSGGGALIPNVGTRLNAEMSFRERSFGGHGGFNVANITTNQKPRSIAWVGGSIMASISAFEDHHITKEVYREEGMSVVSKRPYMFPRETQTQ